MYDALKFGKFAFYLRFAIYWHIHSFQCQKVFNFKGESATVEPAPEGEADPGVAREKGKDPNAFDFRFDPLAFVGWGRSTSQFDIVTDN